MGETGGEIMNNAIALVTEMYFSRFRVFRETDSWDPDKFSLRFVYRIATYSARTIKALCKCDTLVY